MSALEAKPRLAADAFVHGVAEALSNATIAEVAALRAPASKAPKAPKAPKPAKKAKPKVVGRSVSFLSVAAEEE